MRYTFDRSNLINSANHPSPMTISVALSREAYRSEHRSEDMQSLTLWSWGDDRSIISHHLSE